MYAVYRVTPDMWEWPWVSHVLSQVTISGYKGLDFRTRPTPHPRRQRLARTLESGLPARLRPTNRLLRSATDFHDFSIYVYNTWALDSGIVAELSRLASRFEHVGLISIDESMQDSPEIYEHVTFAVRIGFGSQKYGRSKNLIVAPLGAPKHFVQPKRRKPITERDYSWTFLGEIKNPSRRNMVTQLERARGKHLLHSISEWNARDSVRGEAYSNTLANSVFVPSPSANVHYECYRTYETLECNAIPIVDTDYYREEFDAPFPVVQESWEDAPEMVNELIDDPAALADLGDRCQAWWRSVKSDVPERLASLASSVREKENPPSPRG
jgi:hypothetical protein